MDRLVSIPIRVLVSFIQVIQLTLLSPDLFVSIPIRVLVGKLNRYHSP